MPCTRAGMGDPELLLGDQQKPGLQELTIDEEDRDSQAPPEPGLSVL